MLSVPKKRRGILLHLEEIFGKRFSLFRRMPIHAAEWILISAFGAFLTFPMEEPDSVYLLFLLAIFRLSGVVPNCC